MFTNSKSDIYPRHLSKQKVSHRGTAFLANAMLFFRFQTILLTC